MSSELAYKNSRGVIGMARWPFCIWIFHALVGSLQKLLEQRGRGGTAATCSYRFWFYWKVEIAALLSTTRLFLRPEFQSYDVSRLTALLRSSKH